MAGGVVTANQAKEALKQELQNTAEQNHSQQQVTSNTRVPKAHQSTPFPWPLFSNISGARYSGVPQNVLVPPSAPAPVIPLLASPKSVSRRCPFASRLEEEEEEEEKESIFRRSNRK
jgi:hypothetical protein